MKTIHCLLAALALFVTGTGVLRAAEAELKLTPQRVIVIFDKSGSMAWDTAGNSLKGPPGADGVTHMLTNKLCMEQPESRFYQAWAAVESVVKDYATASLTDDFSLDCIVFDSKATALDTVVGKSTAFETLQRKLKPAFEPGGETDIIGALREATARVKAIKEADQNNHKSPTFVVLFVTDGEQSPGLDKSGLNVGQAIAAFAKELELSLAEDNSSKLIAITWLLPGHTEPVIPKDVEKKFGIIKLDIPTDGPLKYGISFLNGLTLSVLPPDVSNGKVRLKGSVSVRSNRKDTLDSVTVRVGIESSGKVLDQTVELDMRGKSFATGEFAFPEFSDDDVGPDRIATLHAKVSGYKGVNDQAQKLIVRGLAAPVTRRVLIGEAPRVRVDYPDAPYVTTFADMTVDVAKRDFLRLAWNKDGAKQEVTWDAIETDSANEPQNRIVKLFTPDGKELPKRFRPDAIFKDADSAGLSGTLTLEVTGKKELHGSHDIIQFKGAGIKPGSGDRVSAVIETHLPVINFHGIGGDYLIEADEGRHDRIETVPLACVSPGGDWHNYKLGVKLTAPATYALLVDGKEVPLSGGRGEIDLLDSTPMNFTLRVPVDCVLSEQSIEFTCSPLDLNDKHMIPSYSGAMNGEVKGRVTRKINVYNVRQAPLINFFEPRATVLLPDEAVESGALTAYYDTLLDVGAKPAKIRIETPPYSDVFLELDGRMVEGSQDFNRKGAVARSEKLVSVTLGNATTKQHWVLKQRTSIKAIGPNGTVPRALCWIDGQKRPTAGEVGELKCVPIRYDFQLVPEMDANKPATVFFFPGNRTHHFKAATCALEETTQFPTPPSKESRTANKKEYLESRKEFLDSSGADLTLVLYSDAPEGFNAVFDATGKNTATLKEFVGNCGVTLSSLPGATNGDLKLRITAEIKGAPEIKAVEVAVSQLPKVRTVPASYELKLVEGKTNKTLYFEAGRSGRNTYTFAAPIWDLTDTTSRTSAPGDSSADGVKANTKEYRESNKEFLDTFGTEISLELKCLGPTGFTAVFAATGNPKATLKEFIANCGVTVTCVENAASGELKLEINPSSKDVEVAIAPTLPKVLAQSPTPLAVYGGITLVALIVSYCLYRIFTHNSTSPTPVSPRDSSPGQPDDAPNDTVLADGAGTLHGDGTSDGEGTMNWDDTRHDNNAAFENTIEFPPSDSYPSNEDGNH